MSRVSKMNLRDIIDQTDVILKDKDIIYICEENDILEEFLERIRKERVNREDVSNFLLNHEKYINKERFIFITIKNYKENIILLERRISELTKNNLRENMNENFKELANLHLQLDQQKDNLQKAIRLGKGIEEIYVYYEYDEEEKRYRAKVADSREIIEGKKISNTKALRRFDEIDADFKARSPHADLGMEYALQSILLTDLYNVFPSQQFGNTVRTMLLENQALKKGIRKIEELERLKLEDYNKYTEFIDNIKFEEVFPDVKNTLREYAQYIDMDKLLLISAYRFQEALEKQYVDSKIHSSVKEILEVILNNIEFKNAQISCELQDKIDETYELESVNYSVNDIKTCMSQFAPDRYITSKEIEEHREKINSCEISLIDILPEHIDVIFSQSDLEKISTLSVDNLLYVFNKFEWEASKIIELYEANKIPLEYINHIKNDIDLSNAVTFEKLNLYYSKLNNNQEQEDSRDNYERYLNLYKELFINEKEQRDIEENSHFIIEKLIENFEGKEYEECIKKYYKEGLITLESIAEWSNESLIESLFTEEIITIADMKNLVKSKKLSVECLIDTYTNLIKNTDMEYNARIALIKEGFVKETDIFDLYKRNLIFEEDLRKMADDGLVRKNTMERLINSRTLKELERNSAIVLRGLNNLTKKNNDIYYDRNAGILETEKTKSTGKYIIDPNEREKFIRLLKAYKANTDLNIDSPFYNYEFYVIPDESGTLGLNSVVIAERYYEDKDTEIRFAMNNATYFFKYKDLMVLGNLRKSEMTKERQNIVFTANHVMANEKREGRWATGVIASVAKTMLSSDLREYNKTNQRKIIQQKLSEVYTTQELMDILSMASDIDLGEYICEIEEPIVESRRKTSRGSKVQTDGDEAR